LTAANGQKSHVTNEVAGRPTYCID